MKRHGQINKRHLFSFVFLACFLAFFLVGCGEVYQDNPLGYNFLIQDTPQAHGPISVPTFTAKIISGLRSVGIGSTPDTFVAKYGKPLPESQPPTLYVFQVSLDTFPAGSALVVTFDEGNDNVPRATQISFVAGDNHPTTYAQAQAIAEAYLPTDTQGPSIINQQDDGKKVCESKGYMSATIANVFPAQDFAGTHGSIAKPGSVVVSFFPHYSRVDNVIDPRGYSGAPGENRELGGDIDNANIVSSVLITLGTKPLC